MTRNRIGLSDLSGVLNSLESLGRTSTGSGRSAGRVTKGFDVKSWTSAGIQVDKLFAAIYSAKVEENDYDRLLFGTRDPNLSKLPPAILDAKEVLPSLDQIPQTRAGLIKFLSELMVSFPDEAKLDLLTAAWPASENCRPSLDAHVESLLQIRFRNPKAYNDLVSGRFRGVIQLVRDLRISEPIRAAQLERALVVQALIWCAHDVHMVIARLSSDVGFGELWSGAANLTPERALNALKDDRAMLEHVLDVYFDGHDWRIGDLPLKPSKGRRRMHLNVTKKAQTELKRQLIANLQPATARKVHDLMCEAANELRASHGILKRTAGPRSGNLEAKQWAVEHYSLSTLAAACVAVLRYVQAEHEMPAIVARITATAVRPEGIDTNLSAWTRAHVSRGSASRTDNLLIMYREAFDPGNDIKELSSARKARRQAEDFVVARGRRDAHDYHGDETALGRAFYLLDVLPEHRFAVGGSCYDLHLSL